MNTEPVCVSTDNFKPESIDLHKPGTIEVKREGDRKTATIERASTVVSFIISRFYLGIVCVASAYDSTNSQGRASYLLARKSPPRMWIACWSMTRNLGYAVALFQVPDQHLKPVACFRRTDLHLGEAGLSDQRHLGRQEYDDFQPALSIP